MSRLSHSLTPATRQVESRLKMEHRLFPRLPLFAGVLITATDVLVVLIFFNSNKGRQGMLFFEILIVTMVRSNRLKQLQPVLNWVIGPRRVCQLYGALGPHQAGLGGRFLWLRPFRHARKAWRAIHWRRDHRR